QPQSLAADRAGDARGHHQQVREVPVHDVTFGSVETITVRVRGSDELDPARIPVAIELRNRERGEPRAARKGWQQARFLRVGAGVQYGAGPEHRGGEVGRAQ